MVVLSLSAPHRRGPLQIIVFVSVAAVLGGVLSVGVAAPVSAAPADQWGLNAINIDDAWKVTEGKQNVTVAVIDSGVEELHPAFHGSRIRTGWNFVTNSAVTIDENGHGTAVTGVAAGRDEDDGFRGAAPNVRFMPLVADDHVQTAKAIDFAIEHGADVINISAGLSGDEFHLRLAIPRANEAGIPVVAAAGNDGRDIDTSPLYPASYSTELPNVISVTSTAENRTFHNRHNFGQRSVTLAAPGVNIRVPDLAGRYDVQTGTSLAAPFVAGTVALMKSVNHMLTPQQIRDILTQTVTPEASLNARTVSGGYLNAARAVKVAFDLEFEGEMLGFRSVSDRTQIIDANGSTNGSRVSTFAAHEGGNQTLIPEWVSGQHGVYRLKFANSGRYLMDAGNSRVTITDNAQQAGTMWRFIRAANRSYRVLAGTSANGTGFLNRTNNNDIEVRQLGEPSNPRSHWWIEPTHGPLTSGASYSIASKLLLQSVIDAAGNIPVGGAAVTLYNNHNGANQRWAACYDTRRGAYRFQNRAVTSVALNLAWRSNSNQRQLAIWDGNWDDQFWVPQLSNDRNWVIANFRNMGTVVDLDNAQTSNNTRILAGEGSGPETHVNNQRWIFNRTTDPILNCG